MKPKKHEPPKPGVKTSEGWLSALTVIGGLLVATGKVSGDVVNAGVQAAGAVAAAAASVGYAVSRAKVKSSSNTGAE